MRRWKLSSAMVCSALLLAGTTEALAAPSAWSNGFAVESTKGGGQSAAAPEQESSNGKSESAVARGRLGDQDLLVVSETSSSSGAGGSSSDATVISVLGNEVVGAESSSDDGASHSTTGVGDEICDGSGGAVCLAVLYGDTESTHGPGGSSSNAHAALATACVNGNQHAPSQGCDGLLSADIAESESSSSSNRDESLSGESSVLARLCIADDASTDACDGVGAVLLESSSSSDGSTSARGLGIEAGGEEIFGTDHPVGFGSCSGSAENCLLLNDGAAQGGTGTPPSTSAFVPGAASATAEGTVLEIRLMDQEIVRASGTGASTSSDGSSSDVTVLSVLGHEVIGAHASSDGGAPASETGYATESCEASDGALCLALLYGRATASEDADSSSGTGDAALLSACVGGEQASPVENCDGPVGLTVAESHSRVAQDKDATSSEADQSSSGADVCLGAENAQDVCEGLGVTVLSSESHSSASPGTTDGDADASTVTVEGNGEEQAAVDQPGTIAVPPGCPADGALVCLTLNDADTSADAPTAEALQALVAPTGDDSVGGASVSRGSTDAAAPGARVRGREQVRESPPGALPRTGAIVATLLPLSVLLIGAGLFLRRRRQHGPAA